ncbi:MAG: hypothetical protein KBB53_13185 [Steroidobacteraceae bacterium]|nr:hypothetical protein [Steroidobacteraceae bacterium]MBP7014777.1 hypothetical protein [Steroidobacteraceae bacterium]
MGPPQEPVWPPVKVSTVVQRGINDSSVLQLLEYFRGTGIIVRLIEYMDVGSRNRCSPGRVVPSRELVARITERWPIRPIQPSDHGEVAERCVYDDGAGEIGFISSVTQPFCGGCTRARISSDGVLFTCLFASQGTNLRGQWLHAAVRLRADRDVRSERSQPVLSANGRCTHSKSPLPRPRYRSALAQHPRALMPDATGTALLYGLALPAVETKMTTSTASFDPLKVVLVAAVMLTLAIGPSSAHHRNLPRPPRSGDRAMVLAGGDASAVGHAT